MSGRALPLWVTIDGHLASDGLAAFLESVNPYGVILFARHLKDDAQVKALNSFLKSAPSAPLVALDQEGGRVSRLDALGYGFEGAADAGGDPEKVRANSSRMAETLKALGFDVNFAPVVDLGPAEAGTGLEGRVYSDDKLVVKECAQAFLEGMEEHGIKACLKHFPGLGGSKVDSHKSLPVIGGSPGEREDHLYPYRGLRADYAMVAHSSYGFLESGVPSTLSPRLYSMLRETGCCGKIVTDDLSMGAMKGFGTLPELAKMSLDAGADLALVVCGQADSRAIAAKLEGAGDGC